MDLGGRGQCRRPQGMDGVHRAGECEPQLPGGAVVRHREQDELTRCLGVEDA